jgi:hypothetical protein
MFLSHQENWLFVVPGCPEIAGMLERTALVRQLRCISEV